MCLLNNKNNINWVTKIVDHSNFGINIGKRSFNFSYNMYLGLECINFTQKMKKMLW